MSIETLTAVLFLGVLVVFSLGTPVGFGLGGLAMLVAVFSWGPQAFKLIATSTLNTVTSFIILSIPLFIFMGQLLVKSGLGEAMFRAAHVLAGRIRGGLALGVIAVCSLIGAMVGIIGAGIMTAGTIALPPMLARGYDRRLALGVIMAAGSLGILIPPSVPMIIFGAATNTSIGRLFAGALGPALLMVVLFAAYVLMLCRLRPEAGPAIDLRPTLGDRLVAARDGGFAFLLILAVLGSILGGLATPTEAGAVGALGAALVAAVYGRFSPGLLTAASLEAGRLTTVIMWIVVGAAVFSNFHLLMGAGRLLKSFTADSGLPPWAIILAMQVSMVALGLIIDEMIIVIVCAPLYTPVAVALGYDPVWFGILMIINMTIAVQTPPYGFALFYLKAAAPPDVTMADIYRSIAPFLAIKVVVLLTVMAFPAIVTWLPGVLFR
ncbi:MAG: TRAP transporter large permease subunit [Rhodobacteraceae bacterium]|nr:TRAP transporter large permease subunit [Paracoccaceae bacterium]